MVKKKIEREREKVRERRIGSRGPHVSLSRIHGSVRPPMDDGPDLETPRWLASSQVIPNLSLSFTWNGPFLDKQNRGISLHLQSLIVSCPVFFHHSLRVYIYGFLLHVCVCKHWTVMHVSTDWYATEPASVKDRWAGEPVCRIPSITGSLVIV